MNGIHVGTGQNTLGWGSGQGCHAAEEQQGRKVRRGRWAGRLCQHICHGEWALEAPKFSFRGPLLVYTRGVELRPGFASRAHPHAPSLTSDSCDSGITGSFVNSQYRASECGL